MADVQGVAVPGPIAASPDAAIGRVHSDARVASVGASWSRTVIALDAAMLLVAALAADLGARAAGVPRIPIFWLVAFPVGVLVVLHVRSLHTLPFRVQVLDDLRGIATSTVFTAMAVLALRVLFDGGRGDLAAQSVRLWTFTIVYLAAGRVALDWSQLRARQAGEAMRPTLIIGAGRVGRLAARRLLEHPEFGLQPVGFLDKEPLDDPSSELPVLGASWDLEEVLERQRIEHVIVTFSTAPNEVLLRAVERCEELGVEVSLVPRLFERVTHRLEVEHIGGLPLLFAHRPNPKGLQFALKYLLDRLVALALLLLVSPLLLALAVAVNVSSGRPILFRQRRVGVDGREFEMLKFRTMHGLPESAGEADAAWLAKAVGREYDGVEADVRDETADCGDRQTRLGRIMRKLSLDELPQLWNVLRGDMALVGPRPERVGYVREFEQAVYRYGDRHRVKSGITGWAQVHGLRGETSLSDRVEWDNYYIENWSFWLDVKIILMTFRAVFTPLGRAA